MLSFELGQYNESHDPITFLTTDILEQHRPDFLVQAHFTPSHDAWSTQRAQGPTGDKLDSDEIYKYRTPG